MILGLLLFALPSVALFALGAAWQRRLYRFQVRAWMAQNAAERGLQGALMLHVTGDPWFLWRDNRKRATTGNTMARGSTEERKAHRQLGLPRHARYFPSRRLASSISPCSKALA